jgi:hypothetical protein
MIFLPIFFIRWLPFFLTFSHYFSKNINISRYLLWNSTTGICTTFIVTLYICYLLLYSRQIPYLQT